MTSFEFRSDGVIISQTIAPFPRRDGILMRVSAEVVAHGDEMCGAVRSEDTDIATFEIHGAVASVEETQALRAALQATARPVVCARYAPNGTTLVSRGTINEHSFEHADQVIWVSPGEGYKVRVEGEVQ